MEEFSMATRRTFFSAIALSAAALWPSSTFAGQRRRRRRAGQPAAPTTKAEPITHGSFPTGYYYRDRDIEFVVPDLKKWSKLGIGMTSEDVRRLLGPPLEDSSRDDPEYGVQIEVDLPDEQESSKIGKADAADSGYDEGDFHFRQQRRIWNETWSYGHFKFLTNDLYWDHFGLWFVGDYLNSICDPFGGDVDGAFFGGGTNFGMSHSQHLSYDGRPTVPRLLTPYPDAKLTHQPFILDFRWLPVCGEYPIEYELEVSGSYVTYDDKTEQDVKEWFDAGTERTRQTHIASLAPGSNPCRWRVRAKNRLGTSAWSEYRYFQFG